jgi:hypothetical protein
MKVAGRWPLNEEWNVFIVLVRLFSSAIQYDAEPGTILTGRFELRPHSTDSWLQFDLAIAQSGGPGANPAPRVSPARLKMR